jgi:hypothetical protein
MRRTCPSRRKLPPPNTGSIPASVVSGPSLTKAKLVASCLTPSLGIHFY